MVLPSASAPSGLTAARGPATGGLDIVVVRVVPPELPSRSVRHCVVPRGMSPNGAVGRVGQREPRAVAKLPLKRDVRGTTGRAEEADGGRAATTAAVKRQEQPPLAMPARHERDRD